MNSDLYDRNTVLDMKEDWLRDGPLIPRIVSVEQAEDILCWLSDDPVSYPETAKQLLDQIIIEKWEQELERRKDLSRSRADWDSYNLGD